jgi:1,4-alpha-glucan branching enzyme
MLKKNYSKTRRLCRVTFNLPAEVNAARASLCGDFNEWSSTANAMKLRKDGRFSTTLSLTAGQYIDSSIGWTTTDGKTTMLQMATPQTTSAQKIPWSRFNAVMKSYEVGE